MVFGQVRGRAVEGFKLASRQSGLALVGQAQVARPGCLEVKGKETMTHYAKKYQRRLTVLQIAVVLLGTLAVILAVKLFWRDTEPQELIVPFVKDVEAVEYDERVHLGEKWYGTASYYSIDGCVGCNDRRIMANGVRLDDNIATVAFNKLPLGSTVRIRNLKNDMIVTVEVTDTGGFERLGRIADLSLKTKRMINCEDLCLVEVAEIL